MRHFIMTLVLLVSFLVNAYAGAAELDRGDLDAAAELARIEQKAAERAMGINSQNDSKEDDSDAQTLLAELE